MIVIYNSEDIQAALEAAERAGADALAKTFAEMFTDRQAELQRLIELAEAVIVRSFECGAGPRGFRPANSDELLKTYAQLEEILDTYAQKELPTAAKNRYWTATNKIYAFCEDLYYI